MNPQLSRRVAAECAPAKKCKIVAPVAFLYTSKSMYTFPEYFEILVLDFCDFGTFLPNFLNFLKYEFPENFTYYLPQYPVCYSTYHSGLERFFEKLTLNHANHKELTIGPAFRSSGSFSSGPITWLGQEKGYASVKHYLNRKWQ